MFLPSRTVSRFTTSYKRQHVCRPRVCYSDLPWLLLPHDVISSVFLLPLSVVSNISKRERSFDHTVLPPSTTNLSSWKNWLTTVCLYSLGQQRIAKAPSAQLQHDRRSPSSFVALSIRAVSAPAFSSHPFLPCAPGMHLSSSSSHIL